MVSMDGCHLMNNLHVENCKLREQLSMRVTRMQHLHACAKKAGAFVTQLTHLLQDEIQDMLDVDELRSHKLSMDLPGADIVSLEQCADCHIAQTQHAPSLAGVRKRNQELSAAPNADSKCISELPTTDMLQDCSMAQVSLFPTDAASKTRIERTIHLTVPFSHNWSSMPGQDLLTHHGVHGQDDEGATDGLISTAPAHPIHMVRKSSQPIALPEANMQTSVNPQEVTDLTGDVAHVGSANPVPEGVSTIPSSEVTSLVVRNVPARYSQEDLLKEWPPDGSYDFVHLPYFAKHRRSAGYAFINFTSNTAAREFQYNWQGCRLARHGRCAKRLDICVAKVQGLFENLMYTQKALAQAKERNMLEDFELPIVFSGTTRLDARQVLEMQWLFGI